jgi:hypothetical protein
MRICWGFCGDYFRVLDRYAVKDAKGSKKERSSARVNACPSVRGVSKEKSGSLGRKGWRVEAVCASSGSFALERRAQDDSVGRGRGSGSRGAPGHPSSPQRAKLAGNPDTRALPIDCIHQRKARG